MTNRSDHLDLCATPRPAAGRPGRGPGRPSGSAYIVVLGASLMVTVLGIGALQAARSRRAADEARINMLKARLAAETGIDIAMDAIANDSSWRQTYTSGTWLANRRAGEGRFTVEGTDPSDGNLGDKVTDPVDLVSTGTAGAARQKVMVSLTAVPNPLTCLKAALCSGGAQTHTGTAILSDNIIASNLTITAVAADITGDIEATAAVGVTFRGTTTILATPRTLPDGTVFAQYIPAATTIVRSAIPQVSGTSTIERAAIGPSVNPLGASSAAGVYVVDCAGQPLNLRNLRFVGTLVVLNTGGSGVTVSGSVNWSPAASGYPCLLVDGPLTLSFSGSTPLSETGAPSVNFNPAGMPHQGATDSDASDAYTSEIRGLVYASGSVTTSGDPSIVGVLVAGGGVSTSGKLTLAFDSTIASNPPAGFATAPTMKVTAGSWRQIVDP